MFAGLQGISHNPKTLRERERKFAKWPMILCPILQPAWICAKKGADVHSRIACAMVRTINLSRTRTIKGPKCCDVYGWKREERADVHKTALTVTSGRKCIRRGKYFFSLKQSRKRQMFWGLSSSPKLAPLWLKCKMYWTASFFITLKANTTS